MRKYDIPNLSPENAERVFHQFRWPKGIKCPKCNATQNKIDRDKKTGILKYYCEKCRLWSNDFTGTALEGTHLTLSEWFNALYLFLKLEATAVEAARQLNINRNTAQDIQNKISRDKLWCQLLLNQVCGHLKQEPAVLFSVKEVSNYLQLSIRHIYHLLKTGVLSAERMGGQWRFRPEEIQKYLNTKLTHYGITAVKEHHFFRPEVMDKYRQDPVTYYIDEDAYQGWVGSKADHRYVQKLLEKSTDRKVYVFHEVQYYNIHYFRVVTPECQSALAVNHKAYQNLPTEEYVHWSGFLIKEIHYRRI